MKNWAATRSFAAFSGDSLVEGAGAVEPLGPPPAVAKVVGNAAGSGDTVVASAAGAARGFEGAGALAGAGRYRPRRRSRSGQRSLWPRGSRERGRRRHGSGWRRSATVVGAVGGADAGPGEVVDWAGLKDRTNASISATICASQSKFVLHGQHELPFALLHRMLQVGVGPARVPLGVGEIRNRRHCLAPDPAFSVNVVAGLADRSIQQAGAEGGAGRSCGRDRGPYRHWSGHRCRRRRRSWWRSRGDRWWRSRGDRWWRAVATDGGAAVATDGCWLALAATGADWTFETGGTRASRLGWRCELQLRRSRLSWRGLVTLGGNQVHRTIDGNTHRRGPCTARSIGREQLSFLGSDLLEDFDGRLGDFQVEISARDAASRRNS